MKPRRDPVRPRDGSGSVSAAGREALRRLLRAEDGAPRLDALLSKLPAEAKARIAPRLPLALRIPAALAESLGLPKTPRALTSRTLLPLVEELLDRLLAGDALPQGLSGSERDFPRAWLDAVVADWGDDVARRLCRELTRTPTMSLRVQEWKDRDAVLATLARETGHAFEASPRSPWGIWAREYVPIMKTEPFLKGAIELQDEGSQILSAFALDPERFGALLSTEPGMDPPTLAAASLAVPLRYPPRTVVDACAGAGGKALAISAMMGNRGRIFAYDVYAAKTRALRTRLSRTQRNNVQAKLLDEGNEASALAPFFGTADIVLVDAPCSGWGVLKRTPDAKWNLPPEKERKRLEHLQVRLLDLYSKLVRPGGRLVYGSCTFRRGETEGVVERFRDADFRRVAGGFYGPHATSDGFFMTAWTKR